ncbi:NAD(+) synthase [Deltaproteobacteria bacterium TL4]
MRTQTCIKVGGASLNQTPLDWVGNQQNIRKAIKQAQKEHVSILCLPELCISGYGCEDAFHSSGVAEMAFAVLKDLIPLTKNIGVALGLPLCVNHVMYNALAWVCDGKLQGLVAKQFLAGQDLYYENRWFKPWPVGLVTRYKYREFDVPLGDLVFDMEGVRVGFEICEDAWVPNRPGTRLIAQGIDVILNASASHFAFKQFETRCQIVTEGARVTNTIYVYSNLMGCEAGRIIYDGTTLIATGNQGIVAQGDCFSYQDWLLTTATVDPELNRLQRRKNPNYCPDVTESHCRFFCSFPWKSQPVFPTSSPVVLTPRLKYEEFSQAVALGLWDYLRKTRSCGFVVSVSGGADSSTVVVLIYIMVRLALKELGWKEFSRKLAHIPAFRSKKKMKLPEMMHQLLLTVHQASDFSSETTYSAARRLCEAIHARFLEFKISEVLPHYQNWMEAVLERPLSWEKDDLALQNIQARVRGPSVWMLANVYQALLLSTSNRSEAAVGYATMDGDTCGGLSPIAGIDKAFILRWLRWMEQEGFSPIGPLPILKIITSQQPTAELRPQEAEQSDESDLMPYIILDAIEKAAIRDRKMPLQVWETLQVQFSQDPQCSPAQLAEYVERFFILWSRNQWKRERYAPSFHLDDENLDPKTWCRFPILSGGFTEELKHLRKAINS